MLALLLLNRMNARRRARRQSPAKLHKTEGKTSETLYCRTCLNTQDLVSIFYSKEAEQKRSHDLKLVTGLESSCDHEALKRLRNVSEMFKTSWSQLDISFKSSCDHDTLKRLRKIKMDDGLSQKICTRCIEIMNSALQFRRTSKKSEKALLNMISGKPKKKYTSRLQKALKPKIENSKVEKVEMDDYSFDIYGDQFQDQNDDYEMHLSTQPKNMQKQTKKKRMRLPNCGSYKCGTCNKEFRMKATYKAHMRFHTNYCVCEACGKRCRNNNQLQEHKRARHGLCRIHTCAYCDYSAATKEALTIHERRHTGERPYVCDHCGATFHRRSNLVQHIAIHLPEKNFQCPICNKREKSKKRLQVHQYKVHREHHYRYLCPRCPKTYKGPDHVRRHLVTFHNLPRCEQGPVEKYVAS